MWISSTFRKNSPSHHSHLPAKTTSNHQHPPSHQHLLKRRCTLCHPKEELNVHLISEEKTKKWRHQRRVGSGASSDPCVVAVVRGPIYPVSHLFTWLFHRLVAVLDFNLDTVRIVREYEILSEFLIKFGYKIERKKTHHRAFHDHSLTCLCTAA